VPLPRREHNAQRSDARSASRDPTAPAEAVRPWIARPRIVTLDAPSIAEALVSRNYSVVDGTLGQPFVVEKDEFFIHVPQQVRAPGLTEADMVIVDLQGPDAVDDAPDEDPLAPGVKSIWSSKKHGVIDPRPRGMQAVADLVDRIHTHGGVLIAIAAERFTEPSETIWSRL
jgi:hypothetical protein